MLHKIEELRKKPKHVRDRYAVTGAVLMTAFVAIFWLASLPSRFSEIPEVAVTEDAEGGFSRALSDVKGQFAGALDSIEGVLGDLEDMPEIPTGESVGEEESGIDNSLESMYELDFEAMFATSSDPEPVEEEKKEPPKRQILIATTSSSVESN